jgi:hypothetical protein
MLRYNVVAYFATAVSYDRKKSCLGSTPTVPEWIRKQQTCRKKNWEPVVETENV